MTRIGRVVPRRVIDFSGQQRPSAEHINMRATATLVFTAACAAAAMRGAADAADCSATCANEFRSCWSFQRGSKQMSESEAYAECRQGLDAVQPAGQQPCQRLCKNCAGEARCVEVYWSSASSPVQPPDARRRNRAPQRRPRCGTVRAALILLNAHVPVLAYE